MAKIYRVGLIGCGRMGGTIDDEVESHPHASLPYSHAAGYTAVERTDLVAAADLSEERLKLVADRWDIPQRYTDYQEMIDNEKPEIVSIATRPETHAEMAIFAAQHGVQAIYCEKPLCCSMEEADAIVDACEKHGVKFNLGTNRRYTPGYWKVRELIEDGEIGDITAVYSYSSGNALWTHTHTSDMLLFLAGDPEITGVQGSTLASRDDLQDNRLESDPGILSGFIQFATGVRGYLTSTPGYEFEVAGTTGKIRIMNNGADWHLWKKAGQWGHLTATPFPDFADASGTENCIRDLVEALDSGGETRGPVQLARRSQELIMAIVESDRLDGRRVKLPLENRRLYIGGW